VAHRGELLVRRGDARGGVVLLTRAMRGLAKERHAVMSTSLACALAQGLAAIGEHANALAAIDDAIATTMAANGDVYDLPEMHRLRGVFLATRPSPDVEAAEESWRAAIAVAQRQSAVAWELRAATALARHALAHGRRDAARGLVAPLLARFEGGAQTADLQAARAVLDEATDASRGASVV
jgi:hypothetical protein